MYCSCPFHKEKTPSFSWLSSRSYGRCFGCEEAGKIIDIYRKMTGKNFFPSVIFLAKFFKIKLQFGNVLEQEKQEEGEEDEN